MVRNNDVASQPESNFTRSQDSKPANSMIAVLDTQLLKAFLAKKPQKRMFRSVKMFNTQHALYGHLLSFSEAVSENVR